MRTFAFLIQKLPQQRQRHFYFLGEFNTCVIDNAMTSCCLKNLIHKFETGLSDFHMMVVTELKMGFPKLKRVMLAYCDYKHFNLDNTKFRSHIQGFTSKKSEI